MANAKSFNRQSLIVTKLKSKPCSFQDILEYLESHQESISTEAEFSYSERTFIRDKKFILNFWKYEIEYCKRDNLYKIDTTGDNQLNQDLLQAYEIHKTISNFAEANQYVFFQTRKAKGAEHIITLLNAIEKRKQVVFNHHNYWEDTFKIRQVNPLALKEFNNRWYLIAQYKNRILNFGLDRISDISIKKIRFEYPNDFDGKKMFDDCYGITIGEDEKEVVQFKCSKAKSNYFISMPLHHSQEFEEKVLGEIIFKYNLSITIDFIMELLSHGDSIQVLSPKSLVNDIKKRINGMAKLYSK
jgi:proteasome accessory factor B